MKNPQKNHMKSSILAIFGQFLALENRTKSWKSKIYFAQNA